jgi:hypothetical protein
MLALINEAYNWPNKGHDDYIEAFVIEMNK